MKRRLEIHYLMVMSCAMILSGAFGSANHISAQERLQRPPASRMHEVPVVPVGAQWVPAGTVLCFEMETPLSSKYALPSDRFRARLCSPVIDTYGRTVIPVDSVAEGHVVEVKAAQRPRRSGVITVSFDRLRLRGGRVLPLRGVLVSADPRDRKQIDEEKENQIRPSSTRARDVAFVGGGAGAGAGIGLIAGGALAGAGIGAAVGATTLLLTKGPEAKVEPGHRFCLELSKRLYLRPPPRYGYERTPIYTYRYPRTTYNRGSLRAPADLVDVSSVRAERAYNGTLRILITAETPTTGWRIYTNHYVSGDTVEVQLRGASEGGYDRISHPSAPPIIIADRDFSLHRVIVRARNGTREVIVEDGTYQGSYPSSSPPPYPANPDHVIATSPAMDGVPIYRKPPPVVMAPYPRRVTPGASRTSPPVYPRASATQLGLDLAREIERLRADFGASIGFGADLDGRYDGRATREESSLLNGRGSLLASVRAYNNSPTIAARQNNALKIQEDVQVVEQGWLRVKMGPEFNQRFRNVLQNARALVATTQGRSNYATTTPVNSPAPTPRNPEVLPKPKDTHVVGLIQQVQLDYGPTVGAWFERDGSYEVIGRRQPTATEKQILSGLIELLNSVRALNSARDASERRSAAADVRDAAGKIEQNWMRVRLSPDLNQKFRVMLQESRALADSVSR